MAPHRAHDTLEFLFSALVSLIVFSPPIVFVVGATLAWEGPPAEVPAERTVCVARLNPDTGAYKIDATCIEDILDAVAPTR